MNPNKYLPNEPSVPRVGWIVRFADRDPDDPRIKSVVSREIHDVSAPVYVHEARYRVGDWHPRWPSRTCGKLAEYPRVICGRGSASDWRTNNSIWGLIRLQFHVRKVGSGCGGCWLWNNRTARLLAFRTIERVSVLGILAT